MEYKTIFILDWDGTVANTFPSGQKILRKLAKRFNVSLNESSIEEYKAIWGRGDVMIKHWFPNCDHEEVRREWRKLENDTITGVELINDTEKVIRDLQGRGDIVGLLTNRSWKSLKRYENLWKPLNFDFIQTSEYKFKEWIKYSLNPFTNHLVTRKPKPNSGCFEPFLNWLKRKRIKPKKIYYIGDSLSDFEAVTEENKPYVRGYNIEFIGVLTGPIKTRREWYEITGATKKFLILRSIADLPKWLEDREKEERFNFKIKLF